MFALFAAVALAVCVLRKRVTTEKQRQLRHALVRLKVPGAVTLLRAARRVELASLFSWFYNVHIDDEYGAISSRQPTIYASTHYFCAYDRALIQWLDPKCKCIALLGFEAYGSNVEGCIPIIRAPLDSKDNDGHFEEAVKWLASGGSLWIATGGHVTRFPCVLKTHTGFARIAKACEAFGVSKVRIVPCSFQFEQIYAWRSNAFMSFGRPMDVEPSAINVLALRELVDTALQDLCLPGAPILLNPFEAWLRVRAEEAWSGTACGQDRSPLGRIKALRRLRRLGEIIIPDWFVEAVRLTILSMVAPVPSLLSKILPSTVGLSPDIKGPFLVLRSWFWHGCISKDASFELHLKQQNSCFDCYPPVAPLVCECCMEAVPHAGGSHHDQLCVFHWHVGSHSAKHVCNAFRSSLGPLLTVRAVVCSSVDPGTLHVLHSPTICIRDELVSAFPSLLDTVCIPCPPDAIPEIISTLQCGGHNASVSPWSSELLSLVCIPVHLANASAVEAEAVAIIGADLRVGELIAQTIALRAGSLPFFANHDTAPWFVDIGGGDGRKTAGIACMLGLPLDHARIWEVGDAPWPSVLGIPLLLHAPSLPFVCTFDGVVQPAASVALMTALQCLHHVPSAEICHMLFAKMAEVMVMGGIFVLKEHDCDPEADPALAERICQLHLRKNHSRHPMSSPTLLRSRSWWVTSLAAYGFVVLSPADVFVSNPSSIASQEANPKLSLLDARAHPNATFVDVFRYVGSHAAVPVISTKSPFATLSDPVMRRSMRIDPRDNAWRPVSKHLQAAFLIPSGKWSGQVSPWFSGHTGSVDHVSGDLIPWADVLISTTSHLPRGYVGNVLDSPYCILRLSDRLSTQELVRAAVVAGKLSHKLFVPTILRLQDGDDYCGPFPCVCKYGTSVVLCSSTDDIIVLPRPCIVEEWVYGYALFKVECIGNAYAVSSRRTFQLGVDRVDTVSMQALSRTVPDAAFTKSVAGLMPDTALVQSLVTVLRSALGLSLFGVDLIASDNGRFAIVDVNHFPGYKQFKGAGDAMQALISSSRISLQHAPSCLVLVGPPAVNAVAVELANRLCLPCSFMTAMFPSETASVREWPFGISAVTTFLAPAHYAVLGAPSVTVSEKLSYEQVSQLVETCLMQRFLLHCRIHPNMLASLPDACRIVVSRFLDAQEQYSSFLTQLIDVVCRSYADNSCDVVLGHVAVTAGLCWDHVAMPGRTSSNRRASALSLPAVAVGGTIVLEPSMLSPLPIWEKDAVLQRCSSRGICENEFVVIETPLAYDLYIAPRLQMESVPTFLAELVRVPTSLSSHAHLRRAACGTLLSVCIDCPDGSGWLLSPNPKYCNPCIPYTLQDARDLPFIAYWIAPVWYTSAFKEATVLAAAVALSVYDIDRQASASDLFKPNPYYHTLRDVKDVTVFQALHVGAATFFAESFGIQLDELVEDMHYLPQMRFSSLHVHYRHSKLFSRSEMPSRHTLLDVMHTLVAPHANVVFMYVCRFNSFHAMWQLMCEGSIPCERLDFGPCMANRAPVFVVGGDMRATPLILSTASEFGGFIPSDLLCSDSTASLPIPDQTNALAFAAAPDSITDLWRLGSDPGSHQACYVFETKSAYVLGIRELYAREPLPAFLAAIITGSSAQELRVSVEGTNLFMAAPNDDGSGWLICPNLKYHVPTVPISDSALRKDLNFVAWWIARSWWPQVFASVTACVSPIVSTETWDVAKNVSPSSLTKPVGEAYLHTIRDCTSAAPLVSLLRAAESFFLRFGVRLCDLQVIDSHYPPAPRYGTLHIHFRTRRTFNDDQSVMRFPIQAVVNHLETAPSCLTDGSIRFMYPHHTGRAIFRAVELNLVAIRYLSYGSRSPTALPFHVRVGPAHEVDNFDIF